MLVQVARERAATPRAALGVSALVLLVAGLAGCAGRDVPPPPFEDQLATASQEYVIGPADVLRVQVWKNPELSAEVPVRPDGRISLPLLNDVEAAGLTTAELREKVAAGLAEFVTAPDVTVIVTQINSKQVYVVGEVVRPSVVPLTVNMRVLDAIAITGGFTPYADKGDIKVLRSNPDGSVTEYRFDYPDFLRGITPEANVRLRPGDTIVVPD